MSTSKVVSITSLSTLFCLLSGFSTLAYGNLAITSPVNSVWEVGTKNLITWTETGEGPPAPATFALDLMQGPATSLQLIQSIVKDADAKENHYSWEIPKTIQPGNYSLRAGSPPNVVYSTYFEIKGPGSGGSSPPAPTPPKPGKKPEKGVKKIQHDQAKKSSSTIGSSTSNSTTTSPPHSTPSAPPTTTQKPNSTTNIAESKTPLPKTSDQKAHQPAASNVVGVKKTQESIAALPSGQYIGLIMSVIVMTYCYFN